MISREARKARRRVGTETATAGRKQILIRLPPDMHRDLKLLAALTGRSVNDIITGLISVHMAGPGHEAIKAAMTEQAATTCKDTLDKMTGGGA